MRGFLGTGRPDPTLESASPSPPQGSIWHRFDIEIGSNQMSNRCQRGGEGKADSRVGSGRPVPKKPLTRVVLANVPSFRFSFRGNMRTYPRCGFSFHPNVPSFRSSFRGNIRQDHPFGNHPFGFLRIARLAILFRATPPKRLKVR